MLEELEGMLQGYQAALKTVQDGISVGLDTDDMSLANLWRLRATEKTMQQCISDLKRLVEVCKQEAG